MSIKSAAASFFLIGATAILGKPGRTDEFAVLKKFQTLASNDPVAAAARVMELDPNQRPVSVLNIILEPWTAKDAKAAMKWARTLPSQGDPVTYIQLMGMSGKTWPTQYTWCREHAEQIVRFYSGKPVVDAPEGLSEIGTWMWDQRGRIVIYSFDEKKQVMDKDLAGIKELPHLQTLNIVSDQVTNDGLKHLAHLEQLSRLSIRCRQVDDAGLVHLQPLQNLHLLDLGRTSINGSRLKSLEKLPYLRNLTLSGSKVTDEGLTGLTGLDGLTSLQLCYTVARTEGGRIVESDAVEISDAALVHMRKLTNLRRLDVRGTNVTAAGAKKLQKSLAKVQILYGDSSAH